MKGSGCYNCPVRGCTAAYRGIQCAHLRELCGIGFDPETNSDRIRAMSDEELARFLASVENRRSAAGGEALWRGAAHALEWLRKTARED